LAQAQKGKPVELDYDSFSIKCPDGEICAWAADEIAKRPNEALDSPTFQQKIMPWLSRMGITVKAREQKAYAPKTLEEAVSYDQQLQANKGKGESKLIKGEAFVDDKGNRIQPFFNQDGSIARAENMGKTQKPESETKPKDPSSMRKEFTGHSASFVDVRDSYNRVKVAAKNPSAAGDLALIFNYMKMLDPRSTVRESEAASVANAPGVPEKIRALYNRILAGERFSPASRADFVERASMLYGEQLTSHKKLVSEYKRLATSAGVSPDDVIVDFESGGGSDPYQSGAVYEDAEGKQKRYLGGGKWGDL